jgi:hypothetical protein
MGRLDTMKNRTLAKNRGWRDLDPNLIATGLVPQAKQSELRRNADESP